MSFSSRACPPYTLKAFLRYIRDLVPQDCLDIEIPNSPHIRRAFHTSNLPFQHAYVRIILCYYHNFAHSSPVVDKYLQIRHICFDHHLARREKWDTAPSPYTQFAPARKYLERLEREVSQEDKQAPLNIEQALRCVVICSKGHLCQPIHRVLTLRLQVPIRCCGSREVGRGAGAFPP